MGRFAPWTLTSTATLAIFLVVVAMKNVTVARSFSWSTTVTVTVRRMAQQRQQEKRGVFWHCYLTSHPQGKKSCISCRGNRKDPHLRPCNSSRLYHSSSKQEGEQRTDVLLASAAAAAMKLRIPTPEDMEDIGALLAAVTLQEKGGSATAAGDTIFLTGDLGAGKTALARGFVRAATGDAHLRVTSPTYLLSNTYRAAAVAASRAEGGADTNLEVHHIDLYRLSGKNTQEFAPLNLGHVFSQCLSLIEWPVRLPATLVPNERLDIDIRILSQESDDDGADDETTAASADNVPRLLSLLPRSSKWTERLQLIRDEGYVDDLLLVEDV